jgi:hypothetical protein
MNALCKNREHKLHPQETELENECFSLLKYLESRADTYCQRPEVPVSVVKHEQRTDAGPLWFLRKPYGAYPSLSAAAVHLTAADHGSMQASTRQYACFL